MAVSPAFREYVLEQLGRVEPVTARSMFGGAGVYANGLIFGLMTGDTLYLKVDDGNRPAFEAAGMGPFRYQTKDGEAQITSYWELPADLLESPDELRPWVDGALDAARRARSRKKK